MEEKKEKKSGLFISKSDSYLEHKIILNGIDEKRTAQFNKRKEIEVTKEELETIGEHRWLEIKNGK